MIGSQGGRKYEREGIAALYAFTPFKVIYGKAVSGDISYSLVFASPWNYLTLRCERCDKDNIKDIVRRVKDYKDENVLKWIVQPVEYINLDYRVVVYREFPYFEFTQNRDDNILVIDSILFRHLKGEVPENELQKRIEKYLGRRFMLAEFNYNSLNNPRSCKFGLVLLSHRERCPLAGVCPVKSGPGEKCYHYIDPKETYGGIYKVYPHVVTKVFSRHLTTGEAPIVYLHYGQSPLASVHYDGALSIIAYYAGIVFRPKFGNASFEYLYAPMNKNWTVGVRIKHTQGLVIKFNKETVSTIARGLAGDKWLKFKCGLLTLLTQDSKDIISGSASKKSLKPWKAMEKILLNYKTATKILKKVLDRESKDELLEFVIIHSLAHLYVAALREELGLTDDQLTYTIDKADEFYVLYIFETASGGYGFLKALVKEPERLHRILNEALEAFQSTNHFLTTYCGERLDLETHKSNILQELNTLCAETRDNETCSRVEKIVNLLFEIYEKYGISMHPYTIRYALINVIPGEHYEKFKAVVERTLATFNSFDGNVGCGFLEEGCSYGPFLEPFTVSFSALRHLADHQHTTATDRSTTVKSWLKAASREVLIMTANMSNNQLLKLLTKQANRGVDIKILVGKNALSDGGHTCNAVATLREKTNNRVKVKYVENLHSKTIIIDSAAVIHGSFNFTKKGLEENIENIEVSTRPEDVKKYVELFHELWKNSVDFVCRSFR